MPRAVVSKTAETNAVSTYYVSRLAGPRIGRRRVDKGQALEMTEHQARALVASGALVTDKARGDDPWGEAAAPAAEASGSTGTRGATGASGATGSTGSTGQGRGATGPAGGTGTTGAA